MAALIRESARNRKQSKSRAETNCSRASSHRSSAARHRPRRNGKFRETVVDLRRRLILGNRFRPLLFAFQFDARLIERLPFRQILGRQVGSVQRGQRRAVLEVHGHRRKDHAGPGPAGDVADVRQILPEVVVNRRQPRVVGRHRVVHEHLHALPRRRSSPCEDGANPSHRRATARRASTSARRWPE